MTRMYAMARIAIIGVGAIGGVVASLLQSTGQHELVLCVRRPLKELVVETPGIGLRSDMQDEIRPEMRHRRDDADATRGGTARRLGHRRDQGLRCGWRSAVAGVVARDKNTPVAVLQNGVEHRERFARYVRCDRMVPVIVDCPAERRPADGSGVERIIQRGSMSLKVPMDRWGALRRSL